MERNDSNTKLLSGLFFRLLPYQVLLVCINAVNVIVDSLYASNAIGIDAMSAMGLYGPFTHFLYSASVLLVSGSQMLYGKYVGKSKAHIQSVFSVDMLITLGLSAVTALALGLGVTCGLTRRLATDAQVQHMFDSYILGQIAGIPALMLGQQLFAFLSLENRTRRTMTASIACFVVNAAMDQLLVANFQMGTFGLGLASATASWVFCLIQAWPYLRGKSVWKFTLKGCRWSDAAKIFKLGYPGAIARFAEMFRALCVNMLLIRFTGNNGLSAFAAVSSFVAIFWATPNGMTAVSRMLLSISIGEKDRKSTVNALRVAFTRGMAVLCAFSALLVFAAPLLTQFFYHDPSDEVYQMTLMGFRLMPLAMPLGLVSLHFSCYAQIMEKKALAILLPVTDGAIGVLLGCVALMPFIGINGLYIANILVGVICLIVVWVGARVSLKRSPKSLEDIMAIPDGFGAGADERLDLSIKSLDDVVSVSRSVMDFCARRGIDRRRSYFAGLSLEEMAGNVVTHGFARDGKAHSLDLRVVHSGDDIILRLRDDCAPFDPSEQLQLIESEDRIKNVGIRLVYSVAKDVQYQNTLGLNVLTVRI